MRALLLAVLLSGPDRPALCELERVDRASTPSRFCMSCHDGSVVAAGGSRRPGEHPVGLHYASAWARRPFALRGAPAAALVLVEGRVECTTCHDGLSRERFRTALPMARSGLCTSCHEL